MSYRYVSVPSLRVTFTPHFLTILPLHFLLPQQKFTLAHRKILSQSPCRKLLLPHMPSSRVSFFKLQLKLINSVISKICFKSTSSLDPTFLYTQIFFCLIHTVQTFNRAFGTFLIMPRLLITRLCISHFLYHTFPGNYFSLLFFKFLLSQLAKLIAFMKKMPFLLPICITTQPFLIKYFRSSNCQLN